ncbi:MAG: SPASM domain-containing protein [Bacteroidales bacterium]
MLRAANDVDNKETCKYCNLKYICSGGCIATTFGIEGNILDFPKTMCLYNKNGCYKSTF